MRYLMSGGGTAGHINPALAIAGKIKEMEPDAEILFVGTPWGMEAKLVPAQGFAFEGMKVAGFQRKISLTNVKRNAQAVWYLANSSHRAREIVENFKPDMAIGTGGYVCGPVLRKAAQMGVPVVVHEANAFPGVTIKMLAPLCECVMVTVEDAKARIKDAKWFEVTGNPIRSEMLKYDRETARRELGVDDRPLILSFGGSLGARAINESMLGLLLRSAKDGKYNHIHGYGQYGSFVPETLRGEGVDLEKCKNLDVREYINDMPRVLAAADLVICRCGSMTLSELQVQGKPSILVPSPNVSENHQYYNAMALVNRQAAQCIVESDLTPEKMTETIDTLMDDPSRLRLMAQNAKKMAITDASERIYEVIRKVMADKKKA